MTRLVFRSKRGVVVVLGLVNDATLGVLSHAPGSQALKTGGVGVVALGFAPYRRLYSSGAARLFALLTVTCASLGHACPSTLPLPPLPSAAEAKWRPRQARISEALSKGAARAALSSPPGVAASPVSS